MVIGVTHRIPFTQFERPNGSTRQVFTEVSHKVHEAAQELLTSQEYDFTFEAEVLPADAVSLTINDGECDVAIEICANGSEVPKAVERLILNFDPIRHYAS